MTRSPSPVVVEQQLLDDFATYDQHVDVVSAFEWIFTDAGVKHIPDTVVHFERFPSIARTGMAPLTPDFTVLFNDGSAIVGEIAKIGLHDHSVEKLCRQIGNYAELPSVPDGRGGLAVVRELDVMQLVESRIGLTAVKRIIKERYADPAHDYRPPRPPVIVQFSRSEAAYVFQRIPDPANGTLSSGSRQKHVGEYLDTDLAITAAHFVGVKALRAFINDPIKPLYLASHLWTRTWPTLYGSSREDVTVDVASIARLLQEQYGVGRVSDVKQALSLLARAGLAADEGGGAWTVSRKLLGRSGDRDVHKIIARRAAGSEKRLVTRRALTIPLTVAGEDTLF